MNVKRKEKYVPLRDLESGQRFRFKSEPSPQLLFQVCKVDLRCNWVAWNRDTDGYRSESDGNTLVEHVKGHWQPEEEPDGLVAICSVEPGELVDNGHGLWWVAPQGTEEHSYIPVNNSETGQRNRIYHNTLVRVVHGAFVEDGAKIEEAGHE